jgi:hypothetical protein
MGAVEAGRRAGPKLTKLSLLGWLSRVRIGEAAAVLARCAGKRAARTFRSPKPALRLCGQIATDFTGILDKPGAPQMSPGRLVLLPPFQP